MGLIHANGPALKRGVAISDDEFRQVVSFTRELLGFAISDKRRHLMENRLRARLDALSMRTFTEYLAYLESAPDAQTEIDLFIEKVTTNETSFFRDHSQLNYFRDALLTPLIQKREQVGVLTLHIWSAGCSSGEEAYTLAILLTELLGDRLSRWKLEITGTDISSAMLQQAEKGVYARHSLRSTPPDLCARYFNQDGPRFRVAESIKDMVRFRRINLRDSEAMAALPFSDFIFCRNVLIYFDGDMKRQLCNSFHMNLFPHGTLLLGHSETLNGMNDLFVAGPGATSAVYVKPTGKVLRKRGLLRRKGG